MATFLDAFSVLQNFSAIFTLLFVFALVYGLLTYSKFLGEHNPFNAVIAIALAILFILSKTLVKTFEYVAPWFVMCVVFAMFIIMAFRFMGSSEADITHVIKMPITIVIALVVITFIFVLSMGQVFKENTAMNLTSESTAFPIKWGHTLQNPKLLGVIAILFMAVWMIYFLTGKNA